MGFYYKTGMWGMPQDYAKARELWLRAGELGYGYSYGAIADLYVMGQGVPRDMKQVVRYYELAAMKGHEIARHNLGLYAQHGVEMERDPKRAVQHWMISTAAGLNESLVEIRKSYQQGHATKDDYQKALLIYQSVVEEMKSDQRKTAAGLAGKIDYLSGS